jgi:hypothetical protein
MKAERTKKILRKFQKRKKTLTKVTFVVNVGRTVWKQHQKLTGCSLWCARDGCMKTLQCMGSFVTQWKDGWYPMDRRLAGPQSRSGHGGEKKFLYWGRWKWNENYSNLMMEATRYSKKLVSNHHTTRRNNPENHESFFTTLRTSNLTSTRKLKRTPKIEYRL